MLSSKDMVDMFKNHGVVAFKADWTDYDEQITGAIIKNYIKELK